MISVSQHNILARSRNVAQERFKKTGGLPPHGVKMIARWHSTAGNRGVTIFETDTPKPSPPECINGARSSLSICTQS